MIWEIVLKILKDMDFFGVVKVFYGMVVVGYSMGGLLIWLMVFLSNGSYLFD